MSWQWVFGLAILPKQGKIQMSGIPAKLSDTPWKSFYSPLRLSDYRVMLEIVFICRLISQCSAVL